MKVPPRSACIGETPADARRGVNSYRLVLRVPEPLLDLREELPPDLEPEVPPDFPPPDLLPPEELPPDLPPLLFSAMVNAPGSVLLGHTPNASTELGVIADTDR